MGANDPFALRMRMRPVAFPSASSMMTGPTVPGTRTMRRSAADTSSFVDSISTLLRVSSPSNELFLNRVCDPLPLKIE